MWNRERTRRCRRAGTVVLLLGIATSVGLWPATAWRAGTLADLLAACAVGCFTLCVPLLLAPVSEPSEMETDDGWDDVVKECANYVRGICQGDATTGDVAAEMGAGESTGDFAGDGFDCGFDIGFF